MNNDSITACFPRLLLSREQIRGGYRSWRGKSPPTTAELVQSGVTTEFLLRKIAGRGAASVKLAVLFGKAVSPPGLISPITLVLMNEDFVIGYGLDEPHLGRNLPFIAAKAEAAKG